MIRIQEEDFDIGAELSALTASRTDIGAVVTFTGQVRGQANGAPLTELCIEHYPGMTEHELERVEQEAKDRFDLQASLIVHRHGALKPGDNIVLVIAAAAHRDAAFDAARFMMDYLKSRAPFWKCERGQSGDRWVDATERDAAATHRWDTKDAAE